MRFRLPTLFSENFRGPPTNFGKLQRIWRSWRTSKEPLKNPGFPGNLRRPRGTSGDFRISSGEPRITTSGALRGTSADLQGTSGDLRGAPGNLRGPPGTFGATSGDMWGQLPGIFGVSAPFFFQKSQIRPKFANQLPGAVFCVFPFFFGRFSGFFFCVFHVFFVTLRFFRLLCGSTRSLCLALLFKCLALEHRSSHSSGYQGRDSKGT